MHIDIQKSRTNEPQELSSIARRCSGGSAIRDELSFVEWCRGQWLSHKTIKALQAVGQSGHQGRQRRHAWQTAQDAPEVIHNAQTGEILSTMHDPSLKLRELRGIDMTMQSIRDQLTDNLAKLSALDEQIALQKKKLDQMDEGGVEDFTRPRITECLRDLHYELLVLKRPHLAMMPSQQDEKR